MVYHIQFIFSVHISQAGPIDTYCMYVCRGHKSRSEVKQLLFGQMFHILPLPCIFLHPYYLNGLYLIHISFVYNLGLSLHIKYICHSQVLQVGNLTLNICVDMPQASPPRQDVHVNGRVPTISHRCHHITLSSVHTFCLIFSGEC